MLRLFRFIARNAADSVSMNGGPIRRVSSPPFGFSILMTSAPMSASSMLQNGPARICEQSRTRTPSRASGMPFGFGRVCILFNGSLASD